MLNKNTYNLNKWTLVLAALGIVSVQSLRADSTSVTTTNEVVQTNGTNTPPTTESGTVIGSKSNEGFFKRLGGAFREQLGTAAYTEAAPPAPGAPPPPPGPRRAAPAPFDSPPYPNGEWQIGGTEIIGDQNLTPDFPVMQALYEGPHGQAIENTHVKMYGWVDFSGNYSTSHQSGVGPNGQAGNFPLIYPQRPNRFELDQAVLYLERTPDEAQTDHVDWGFRVSGVYGLDYRYMISYGLFSDQLVKGNRFYGFDMPMIYGNLYFPKVAQGLNITIGRVISEADIEAQLAPNNLMSTHSLLYSFDPYTQEGIFGTLKLNNQWTVQAGIADGGDIAIWQSDRGRQPTGTLMVQYQSKNNKFSFYGGANQFNNAEFGYNNLQQYVGTLTYKFSEKLWTTWETWYMYQKHAVTGPTATVPYQNAFYPVKPGYAPEWATLDYTMYRLGPNSFITLRNEIFDDIVGQRTSYNTVYSEHSIGFTYWPSKLITFRPELRFDHSYAMKAYDNGTRHNQIVASFDVIFHF